MGASSDLGQPFRPRQIHYKDREMIYFSLWSKGNCLVDLGMGGGGLVVVVVQNGGHFVFTLTSTSSEKIYFI